MDILHFFKRKKKTIGARGEDIAARFLKKRGYKILARNFYNKRGRALGEIDIIARDGREVVFVEVKSQSAAAPKDALPPEMNITPNKLRKIHRIAHHYLKKRDMLDAPHRFEAVSVIVGEKDADARVRHFRDMFF